LAAESVWASASEVDPVHPSGMAAGPSGEWRLKREEDSSVWQGISTMHE
jgi:hypothetical protein